MECRGTFGDIRHSFWNVYSIGACPMTLLFQWFVLQQTHFINLGPIHLVWLTISIAVGIKTDSLMVGSGGTTCKIYIYNVIIIHACVCDLILDCLDMGVLKLFGPATSSHSTTRSLVGILAMCIHNLIIFFIHQFTWQKRIFSPSTRLNEDLKH